MKSYFTGHSKCCLLCQIEDVEQNQVKNSASDVLNAASRLGTWAVRRLSEALDEDILHCQIIYLPYLREKLIRGLLGTNDFTFDSGLPFIYQ